VRCGSWNINSGRVDEIFNLKKKKKASTIIISFKQIYAEKPFKIYIHRKKAN
jgi:hypothetical protein